ncbi:hypothetical protein [Rhodopseudomonas sp. RCAM05734]|uniref:hypothetical protein n=1 Tax=Rhodopseudomonas sp. RCAM05734 TaxID=3457549 RepID=UPI0040447829
MDERDMEAVLKIANTTAGAVLQAALVTQFTTIASLMMTLAAKGLLDPEDVSIFATRTADMCSQNLGVHQAGIRDEINAAIQMYVDELLTMADTGAGTSGRHP